MCMAEQLVTNSQLLQYLRLQEKENISGRASETRTKWSLRLRSRLYEVMGNSLKMSFVSWSVIGVLQCLRMMRRNG